MMLARQPSCLDKSSPLASRDEELRAVARRALDDSGYRVLTRLECRVVDGAIILSGVVSCFYYKQLAQAAVRRALGGLQTNGRLEDRIDVHDHP